MMMYKGKGECDGCTITIVVSLFDLFLFVRWRHAILISVWCGRAKHGQILSSNRESRQSPVLSSSATSLFFSLLPVTNRHARNGCCRSSRDSCYLLCRFRLNYPTNRTQTSQAWFPIQCHRRWCVPRPLSHPSDLLQSAEEKYFYLTGFWSSGQTGLGKSTLINTIFASHLIDSKGRREADEPVRQTTEIQTVSHGAVFSLLLFDIFVTLRVASLTRMP